MNTQNLTQRQLRRILAAAECDRQSFQQQSVHCTDINKRLQLVAAIKCRNNIIYRVKKLLETK